MATIGLRIAQDPNSAESLSLADTLAKGIFGDPEGQMKARALASEVGVRMASRDKLLADTGLIDAKTRSEKDAEDARLRAGPLVGEAGAAAVPMPVPVEASHADAPGTTGYGPQRGIVSPHDQAVYDTLVARERALGPILVLGDNPNATAEGINKNYGGTILSAAAANPAIVSGDSLRIAGGLSTGSAPTTSTVWSAGDTSGVDAEARGSPQKPDVKEFGGMPYIINADGSLAAAPGFQPTSKAPDLKKDAAGNDIQWDPTTNTWVKAPGTSAAAPDAPKTMTDAHGNTRQWNPATGTWDLTPGGAAPAKIVAVGKDAAVQDPETGGLSTPVVAGRLPIEEKIFAGESTTDEALNFTTNLGVKMGDPTFRPNAKQAAAYSAAYNHLYEQPHPQEFKRPDDSTGIHWVASPPPAGSFTPAQVFARLTGQPAPNGPAPPVQTPPVQTPPVQTPPVAAPPVGVGQPPVATPPVTTGNGPVGTVVTQELSGPVPKTSITSEQEKAQSYLTMGHEANAILSKLTRKTVPSGFEIQKAQYASSPGLTSSLVGWATSDAAKRYNGSAKAFIEAYARPATGATISPADYENFYGAMIPLPTDPQSEFDRKARLRADLEDVWMNGSGFPNEATRDAWFAKHGVNKADAGGGGAGGPSPSNDNAPAKAPPAMKDAWSHMSKDAKDRARQRYGQ